MPFELSDFDMYGVPMGQIVPDPKPTPQMGVASVTPDSGHYASCYLCLAQYNDQFMVRRYRSYIDKVASGLYWAKPKDYVITFCHKCDAMFPGPRNFSDTAR